MSLLDLFKKQKKYSNKWNTYFDTYESEFSRFIGKKPVILEIGVAQGGSLGLWSEFFQNATVYGVDLYPDCNKYQYDDPNIHITIGNQGDPEFWNTFVADKPFFDIIIDDGSHLAKDQITTLLSLFPYLKNDGVYVVEDTHSSYWSDYDGGYLKPDTFVEFSKTLIDFLHRQHFDIEPPKELINSLRNLNNVTFYNSLTMLRKLPTPLMKPIENNEIYAKQD